jgi:tetratricopeptide (TPR) repeat protein
MALMKRAIGRAMRMVLSGSLLAAGFPLSRASAASDRGQADRVYRYGTGARDVALGQSMAVMAQDSSALYWNPSLLADSSHRNVQLFHSRLLSDFTYSYLGYVHPFRNAMGLGVQLLHHGVSGVEGRDAFNAANGGFSEGQTALGIGAGIKGLMFPRLNLGLSLNALRRNLAGRSSSLYGFDVGLHHNFFKKRLAAGVTLKNPASLSSGDTDDKLPTRIHAGLSYELLKGFRVAVDGEDFDRFGAGAEYMIGRHLALQMGRAADRSLRAGGGILYKNTRLDLSFAPNNTGLGSGIAASMNVRFGLDRGQVRVVSAQSGVERAMAMAKEGDWTRALRLLKRCVAVDPTNAAAQDWIRRLEISLDALAVRRVRDEQVWKEKGAWPLVRSAVGSFLEKSERQAQLFAGYASLKAPEERRIRDLLRAYESRSAARVMSKDELDMKPEAYLDVLRKRAEKRFVQRDYGAAVLDCQDILLLEPRDLDALEKLGSLYLVIGEKEKALATFRQVLEINPANKTLQEFIQRNTAPGGPAEKRGKTQ